MRVIDYIIKSLQELDGEAELDEIYKQVNKIESTRAFNERTMLVLWLVLGMVGLITGGL